MCFFFQGKITSGCQPSVESTDLGANELKQVYFDNHKQRKAIAAVERHQSLEILDWQKLDQSEAKVITLTIFF